MKTALAIVALVALQRLLELWYAGRNTRRLIARGGLEIGAAQYPWFIALHTAWLIAVALFLPRNLTPVWWLVVVFFGLQGIRLWAIASLGAYWTTRIITIPGAPLVRRGPYRFIPHPNYCVVIGEIAVLPLAFREVWIAAIFSLGNAILLSVRVRAENAALANRRIRIN